MMQSNARKQGGFDLDILEWNVPEEVLAVLLKDRLTGRNLIWATDDYAARGTCILRKEKSERKG